MVCQIAIAVGLISFVILLIGLFPFNDRAVFWALSSIVSAIGVNVMLRPKLPEQTSPE